MENKEERNILEKITFYSGVVILLILLGYLGFRTLQNENRPPEIVVNLAGEQNSTGNKYRVEVENKGEQTAEATQISFDFYKGGKVSGQAVLQIDFVPQRSKEIGFIIFPGQKTPADSIVIKSISYIQQ